MRLKLSREQKLAHRFLRSYHLVAERLESSVDCLVKADAARSSITASIGALSMSGEQSDRMLKALVRMDDAIDDIAGMASEFSSRFEEVERFVSEVQDIDHQAGCALRLVYIKGLSAKEAADEGDVSKKTVYEHVKRGLDIVYDLLVEGAR